jgi:hypothetical protein
MLDYCDTNIVVDLVARDCNNENKIVHQSLNSDNINHDRFLREISHRCDFIGSSG